MRSRSTSPALRLAACAAIVALPVLAQDATGPHGVMHPTVEQRQQWREERARMPKVEFRPLDASGRVQLDVVLPAKADVLDLLTYSPAERYQGSCGDCWVWASTAMVEVGLAKNYGLKDRLSIQFLNSAKSDRFACGGGSLTGFSKWYNTQKVLVPWSNAGGEYRDGVVNDYCQHSLVDPATIGRTPAYSLVKLTGSYIDPNANTQDQMIAAIKTALLSGHAVGFSFTTNFSGATDGFDSFWDSQKEDVPWNNPSEGKAWDDATWGAHMVTIVGYNAEDPDPAKHYWIVLNSWGTTPDRPTGFFRLPVMMNYRATYTENGNTSQCYWFELVDVNATPATPAAPGVPQVTLSTANPVVAQPLTLTAQVTGTPPLNYQWRKNGLIIPGATSARLVLPCLSVADSGESFDIVVTNAQGSQTSSPVSFPVTGQNLLLNPGVEDKTAWTVTSGLGLNAWYIGANYTSAAHSGSGYFYFGTRDASGKPDSPCTATQKVVIPSTGGTAATLSYWMRSTTRETPKTSATAKDVLTVAVLDEAGKTLQTLKTYSNLDTDYLVWKQDSFDLSAYLGRTIQIQATAVQDTANFTVFRLDDFGLVLGSPTAPSRSPDLNQDGLMDVRDLLIMASEWGKPSSPADLDGSGRVDESDLTTLLGKL